jgi:HSP20 family molecular chaperone IbpA
MITESSASAKPPSEQRQGVVVTVLGAYNRGKSFLLRKLCKIKLPNGNLIHTEGISITAGRENYTNIVFLDTAGTDTPVKNDEIEYKRATEALLREVLLHLSTCILIVVNRLRATDQIYIKQILKYCRNHENKKNIIIVHNLLDIETIEDVTEIINKEIKITFTAIEKSIQLVANGTSSSIKFFTSKQQGVDVRHYVLAKNHSKAADMWNRQSLDGIMNFFQNVDNKRSLDIINDMISFINNKLPELFKQNNNSQSSATHQNLQIIQHENQPYIVLSDRKSRQSLQEEPYALELFEKLAYDDAGYFVRNESGHWQPRYNLYEDDQKYCLIVELSGFKKGELVTNVSEKAVTIEGTRSDLNKSMIDPIIRQSDIPIGSFKLNIPFRSEISSTETISEREDGFIRITVPKKRLDPVSLDI